jgi:uncharacterized membrane protein YhaH (DUF805 family)
VNRFDPDFNDVDPMSGRAFSGGHPDGVWIIAIILGIPLVAAVLGAVAAIVMLFFGQFAMAAGLLVGGAINFAVFLPPIRLLFRRSARALTWIIVLLCVFLFVLALGFLAPSESPAKGQLMSAGIIGSALYASFAYYLFRLRAEELLR